MLGQLRSVLRRLSVKKPPRFAAVLAVSLCAAGLLFISGVTNLWDQGIYDRCIKLRVLSGAESLDRRIAPVDINDESIEIFAEQLDTRAAFADALAVLAQSNTAVVFDLLFKYKKAYDGAFTGAMEISKDAVIAAVAVDKKITNQSSHKLTEAERQLLNRHIWHIKVLQKGDIPQAGTFYLPFPELGVAVKQIAHINIEPDPDGIYRRIPLFYEWDGGYIPSLALATAVLYYQIPVETIELKAGAYLALPLSEEEVIRIPVDKQGRMLIPYSETWKDNNRRIPFHAVVKAKSDDAAFDTVFNDLNNRIALIAEISTEQKDYGPTPFEHLFPLSGAHTAVISGILNGFEKRSFIGMTSELYKILTLLLFLVCAFLIGNTKKDAGFHLGFFIVLLIFSAVTFIRWQDAAIYPWYALPVIMLFFIWAGSFLVRLAGRYKEQLLLQNALSRYFPNALAERIMRERKTELIPDYKDLTILFADIAGFTRWSSEKSPELVHTFLNDYLENMAGILFTNGGTVDKYMGDGIMAFFGDPFMMPDHCERCLLAAIAMQERIRLLAEKWKPLADIDLKVRIGINTGKVIVGNLGNKTRVEYTVIGAAVNLAQRMESNAPTGGILITAAVWEKVKDKFAFSEKQSVTVKGYAEPIEAYVIKLP
ncbi:MAG: adenylate/guanylate cyclase domain-containing protein [Spirochaetaceae bacterium]|jgi:adenylate cyclase|nr:adenylate/guanylate cyclase domain-containing protein [Spirochaetaceae bacterium]